MSCPSRSDIQKFPETHGEHNERKKIFNPKGWLILFAVLHTVMFLLPQLFATTTAAEMAWGEGMSHSTLSLHASDGTLGIAYTPMLLAMALLTTGVLRAKMALISREGACSLSLRSTPT